MSLIAPRQVHASKAMREDEIDPAVRDALEALVPADPVTRYVAASITRVTAPALRSLAVDWTCAQLRRGIGIATMQVRVGPVRDFLNDTGATELAQIDKAAFLAHFAKTSDKYAPQVWYERQRHVFNFMRHHLGAKEAAKRCPTTKATRSWHSNRPPWMSWTDLRRVWMTLELQERAQFVALAATGAPADHLVSLPVEAVSFEPDGIAVFDIPAKDQRRARQVAALFGERSLQALSRMAKDPTRNVKWLFPAPNDPSRPCNRRHLTYRIKTWGERAGVPDLTAPRLQATIVAHMLARGVSPEIIAHLAGLKHTKRIMHLLNMVRSAQESGQTLGVPNFRSEAAGAGLATCEACGRIDNSADSLFCASCGAPLREEMTDRETQIKADIQRRFRMLLDLAGESEAQRVAEALQRVETQEAAA